MPIPELEKFRQKYPGYNDLDDAALASKLATKYPDAYGDLPGKVSQIISEVPRGTEGDAAGTEDRVNMLRRQNPFYGGPQEKPMSFLEKLGQTASNVPKDAGEIVDAFDFMFRNPAKAVGGLVKSIPEIPAALGRVAKHPVDTGAKSIIEHPVSSLMLLRALLPKSPTTAKAISPETTEALRLEKSVGAPMTAAEVTQKPSTAYLEEQLRRNILTANKVNNYDKMRRQKLQSAADRIQANAGGKMEPLEAGQIAQSKGLAREQAWRLEKNKKFDEIPVEHDMPIETPNLRDAAIGISDDIGKTESGPLKRILGIAEESSDIRGHYTPGAPGETRMLVSERPGWNTYKTVWIGKPPKESTKVFPEKGLLDSSGKFITPNKDNFPTYTWAQLRADQSALGKMANSTSDYNKKRMYLDLAHAIDEDISQFASKHGVPEIKNKLDEAIKYFKEGDEALPGVTTWREKQIKNLLKTNSPEDIVNKFYKRNNASDLGRLVRTVGPEGNQALKQAWMEKILTQGPGKSLSPAKFATEFEQFDYATLKSFLTKEEISGLKDLADFTRKVQWASEVAANPSKSGVHGVNFGTVVGYARHPVWGTMSLIGGNALASLYFENPAFRRLLVQGVKGTPTGKAAIDTAKKLARIAGVTNPIATIAAHQESQANNKK